MVNWNRREWLQAAIVGAAGLTTSSVRRASAAQRAAPAGGYSYVHLDVFTDTKLAGNPLLVYLNPDGLDTEKMARLTIESNYSENTFVVAPEQPGTDFRVRIFTRGGEVPFAGHPTIGTPFALAYVGRLKPTMARTVFGLGVGPTPIDLEWKGNQLAFAWMTQLKPTFGKTVSDPAVVAASIGLQPADIAANNNSPAAQEVHTGSNFIIIPLASRRAVDAAVLDRVKVDAFRTANGLPGAGCTCSRKAGARQSCAWPAGSLDDGSPHAAGSDLRARRTAVGS